MPRDCDNNTSGALPGCQCLRCMPFVYARALYLKGGQGTRAYLALLRAFASPFVLEVTVTTYMRARVWCLCGPCMLACSAPACVRPAYTNACAVYCLELKC
mmetsp:Transcript_5401/g.8704  ORF Transcript_5401/g.8704 Transcript_5401/m.8704 type:complete len:101 (+) Transcript_5401:111-413(+)